MFIKGYFNWQQLLIGSCNNKTEIQDWGIRGDVIKSPLCVFHLFNWSRYWGWHEIRVRVHHNFVADLNHLKYSLLIWTIWNIHHRCLPQCCHFLPQCVKQLYSFSKILVVQGHLQDKYIIWRHLDLFLTIFHCLFVDFYYLPVSQRIISVSYLTNNCKIREK